MMFNFPSRVTMFRVIGNTSLAVSLLITGPAFCLSSHVKQGDRIKVKKVLDTEENIIGQKIIYPTGTAKITSELIEVPPKTAIPWHEHLVPMYAYVIEGTIEIDYGEKGIKTIRNGEATIEAVNFSHKGFNKPIKQRR